MGRRLRLLISSLLLSATGAYGDLAVPGWYSEPGASWHYRVPLELPATAAAGATVHLDVDFNSLLTSLGVNPAAVDFAEASVRVVDAAGGLVNSAQFTDGVFNGLLDATGNGRGELRFILENAPAGHMLYFDIDENGSKPDSPAAVINGRFEQSSGATPDGWIRSAVNAGGNQNNEVYRTAAGSSINLGGGCSTGGANGLEPAERNARQCGSIRS